MNLQDLPEDAYGEILDYLLITGPDMLGIMISIYNSLTNFNNHKSKLKNILSLRVSSKSMCKKINKYTKNKYDKWDTYDYTEHKKDKLDAGEDNAGLLCELDPAAGKANPQEKLDIITTKFKGGIPTEFIFESFIDGKVVPITAILTLSGGINIYKKSRLTKKISICPKCKTCNSTKTHGSFCEWRDLMVSKNSEEIIMFGQSINIHDLIDLLNGGTANARNNSGGYNCYWFVKSDDDCDDRILG